MNEKSVYFFLIPEYISRDNYAHNALVLAEGLRELGYQIFANINYWKETPDESSFLFVHDPSVRPEDCPINVLTYDWMHYINVIPYHLQENNKSIRVYLEDAGWLKTPGLSEPFRLFDVIFKAHFNRLCYAPKNYHPWSFGLSRRILYATKDALPFSERQQTIVANFGATHSFRHKLRDVFEQRVYPKLCSILNIDRQTNSRSNPPSDVYHRFMWEQTAGRHYPDYYDRLRSATVCSCVGGQLVSALPYDWSALYGQGGHRFKLRRACFQMMSQLKGQPQRWNQWESWRFWESLAAGCASLMLDFEKYGVQLPVQPENWKHYIGFDLDNLQRDVDRIVLEPEILQRVAQAGHKWAIENYSPDRVANNFLKRLGITD